MSSKPSDSDIDNDADDAIRKLIATEFPGVPFSYSIVPNETYIPNKAQGLGATWNGWYALLWSLHKKHLNLRPEYEKFAIGPLMVEHTLSKTLTSTRIQLRNRLKYCVDNFDS